MEGSTDRDEPVPASVPPQELVYHFQLAPVPKEPPLTAIVLLVPAHVLSFAVTDADEAAEDVVLTVIVCEAHVVDVPQLSIFFV